MLEKQKKLTKKELQEDQLVVAYAKSLNYINTYKLQILSILGAIVVIIVGLFLYTNYMTSNNEQANSHLAKVLPIYESSNFQLAIDGIKGNSLGLKEIVDQYGSTETGQLAKIYLANSLYSIGKYDEALEIYKAFSGNNELLKAASLAGQAACLETKNDYDNAASLYEKAASVYTHNPLNGEYFVKSGKNYALANKTEEAKVLFEKVVNEMQTSSSLEEANRQLAIINSL